MASEDTHTLTVRAGRYAVVDGVTYKCVQYFDDSPIWLSVRYDEPRPAGFTDAPGGGWRRRVLPEEIPELIEITTTARWRDRSVIVRGVSGDSAFIKDGGQDHYVPVADLTEVIEQTVQLPLPPIGSAWVDGPVRAGLYAIYQGKAYATLGPTPSACAPRPGGGATRSASCLSEATGRRSSTWTGRSTTVGRS